MSEPIPATRADYAALLQRALAVGAVLTERLLDLPEDTARNPAADYHLINRAMRQAVLLLQRTEPAPQESAAAANPPARIAARKQIIREVEDAIQYRAGTQAETLRAELLDRLDDDALEAELAIRPVPDIIADICRDLRIISPMDSGRFARRTPDDLTVLCALAARLPGQRPRATLPERSLVTLKSAVRRVGETHHHQPEPQPDEPTHPNPYFKPNATDARQRRAPLSTPSLMIHIADEDLPAPPEAKARDQR